MRWTRNTNKMHIQHPGTLRKRVTGRVNICFSLSLPVLWVLSWLSWTVFGCDQSVPRPGLSLHSDPASVCLKVWLLAGGVVASGDSTNGCNSECATEPCRFVENGQVAHSPLGGRLGCSTTWCSLSLYGLSRRVVVAAIGPRTVACCSPLSRSPQRPPVQADGALAVAFAISCTRLVATTTSVCGGIA